MTQNVIAVTADTPLDGIVQLMERRASNACPLWKAMRWREALRVVAENVAGVKAVEDHLVWIEPVSGIVIDPRQDERGSS